MVTKANARSKPYAPLSARLCFYYSGFAKIFLLILKKNFTKTLSENVKLRRRICYSAKKRIFAKNDLYTPQRENITAITSIPLLSVSKRGGACTWKFPSNTKVKECKNGKFTSNYTASPIDFETQISLRREAPPNINPSKNKPLKKCL